MRSKRHSRFCIGLVLGAIVLMGSAGAAFAAATASSSPASASHPYYLALGDSVPVWNGAQSYPDRILAHYRTRMPGLQLADIAISGETTGSMLNGGQYTTALRFLRRHRGHVALITIDIGGNDVVGCIGATGVDQVCVAQARATIKRNLPRMLAGIRSAAPHVPVFGMTYYNPFLGNWLAGGVIRSLTLTTTPVLLTLNHELAGIFGAKTTANVQSAFRAADLKTMVPSPWGTVPIAVKRACSWLDIVCRKGEPEGFGDDPNPTGAGVIASAFEHTIGVLRRPG